MRKFFLFFVLASMPLGAQAAGNDPRAAGPVHVSRFASDDGAVEVHRPMPVQSQCPPHVSRTKCDMRKDFSRHAVTGRDETRLRGTRSHP